MWCSLAGWVILLIFILISPDASVGFVTRRSLGSSRATRPGSPIVFLSYHRDEKSQRSDGSYEDGPRIVFPGGGIFFYWQAGVVTFLRENYDLSKCNFAGASAGALTATLSATNVDFYEATEVALSLASDAKVWDRQEGLQGIWGPMIREWLLQLLPKNLEDYIGNERLSILVTPVPSFGKTLVSSFDNTEDLISCNMASVHLPWFLDGDLTATFRAARHIDGSFLAKESDYIPTADSVKDAVSPKKLLLLDWKDDPQMQSKWGPDIVETLSPSGIYNLLEMGKSYAEVLEQKGTFQGLNRKHVYDR